VLLYGDTYLFSGDHLAGEDDGGAELHAWKGVCWYSWAEQTRSMESLLERRFSWVLPGHGRVVHAASPERMRQMLGRLVERMRRR
jgi:glyoxylase-like metal-dependent hydrolase (beta-lactamase superfamily II)